MTGGIDWNREFDEPIAAPDGDRIITLRDAIAWLAANVPKTDRNHMAVELAATILTNAAEGRDLMMHARIATLQAMRRHDVRAFDGGRKDPHWGRRKLKRNE